MNLNYADTHIFITHGLPLSNVFIIAHSVSVVLDFRQNPPDLPCFKHQAAGAAAAASPPLPFCQRHFHALNFLFSVQWNDDIRSLLSPVENRDVQTEWEQRIKDGASTQCYTELQRKLMRALDTIYLLYTEEGKHNRLCESTRGWCWKESVVILELKKNVFSFCACRKDLGLFARKITSGSTDICIFLCDETLLHFYGRQCWSACQSVSASVHHCIIDCQDILYRHSCFSENDEWWSPDRSSNATVRLTVLVFSEISLQLLVVMEFGPYITTIRSKFFVPYFGLGLN